MFSVNPGQDVQIAPDTQGAQKNLFSFLWLLTSVPAVMTAQSAGGLASTDCVFPSDTFPA